LISDSELDEKLAILAEAYDILSSMELPEPKIKKRKGPPEQDDFGF